MNVRLVAHRGVFTASGVITNLGSPIAPSTTEVEVTVDGVDATKVFTVGQQLYKGTGSLYGTIKTIGGSTSITLASVENTIEDEVNLYYYPDTQFELDLQKAPNIVANYKWVDLKEPDKRKSNFSQTIKIPFTDRNNKFFENWFDVNLDTLVYSSKKKYNATIYVDSLPQLQGYIQLKAVYYNARLYEVVVFGDTANFFLDIKGKKLRDAFVDENGVVDRQLDHINTCANVVNSWGTAWGAGGLTTLDGVTDNDVMYPLIDWGHASYPTNEMAFAGVELLSEANELGTGYWGDLLDGIGAFRTGSLKPAIRLQRLLLIIAQKAGYQIKSTFLGMDGDTLTDTQWFSRLFMTLAPQYPATRTKVWGGFEYTITTPYTQNTGSAACGYYGCNIPTWENTVFDPFNIYNSSENVILLTYNPDDSDLQIIPAEGIEVAVELNLTIPTTTNGGVSIGSYFISCWWQGVSGDNWGAVNNEDWFTVPAGQPFDYVYTTTMPSEPNWEWKLYMQIDSMAVPYGDYSVITINSGRIYSVNNGAAAYQNGSANAEVNIAENMPDVTQSDFVKDLINRFNLIISADKENPNKLIIEPYQDYITSGTTQYWTDKLDLSKEQVVRPTNEIQSKELMFSDLKDKDWFNDSYFKKWDQVFGSRKVFSQNDFALKDFKTFSIFSPFITNGIVGTIGGSATGLPIGQVYEVNEDQVKKPIESGKPKLFYYSGTPITIDAGLNLDCDFHIFSGAHTDLSMYEAYPTNNKFPLCTQFNLDSAITLGDASTGVTSTTKMLHWTWYDQFFITGFTYPIFQGVTSHGYFNDYWAQYINEIYSDEARIMECYLNLDEQDIFNFDFSNPVYIKNTLWRVLEINKYLVGGNKTTKVKLLKAITKLNYDCDVVPSSFNADGTITFINPATGVTASVTDECCSGVDSNWTFEQSNNDTGVGTCYHNQEISTAVNDLSSEAPGVYGEILGDFSNNTNNPTPTMSMLPMPIFGGTQNTLIKGSSGNFQASTFYLQATTIDSARKDLLVKGLNFKQLRIPLGNAVSLEVSLMGTIQSDDDATSNIGKVGYYNYTTLLKARENTYSYIGSAGGVLIKSNADTGFPTPTVNLTTFTTSTTFPYADNYWQPTIEVSGTQQIQWIAKVDILLQPIARNDDQFPNYAIYQNEDIILFQNVQTLEWN